MSTRILYIEDNLLNMRLVRKILMSMGYTMLEAVDGNSGLQMAAQELPNLILVDINLPDIDGLEVVKRLKEDTTLASIPAVALTSNAMHGDRDRCLAAGFDGYLAKPVARVELKNALEHFLKPDSTRMAV